MMKVLESCLAFSALVLAVTHSPAPPIDSRSLSDIYAAAQKEKGVLHVAYGGDGIYVTHQTNGIRANASV
jgi:hypothetical protein